VVEIESACGIKQQAAGCVQAPGFLFILPGKPLFGLIYCIVTHYLHTELIEGKCWMVSLSLSID